MYVGETGLSLKMRLKEHQYAVKMKDSKNGIAVHACNSIHCVDWEAAKVIAFEQHLTKRKVLDYTLGNIHIIISNLKSSYIPSPICTLLLT